MKKSMIFTGLIKLETHFSDKIKDKKRAEEKVSKEVTNKKWASNKIVILSKLSHKQQEAESKMSSNIRAYKYINLSKKEQKVLEELKNREDIVITNAGKHGTVVILDVKDYVKEF